MAIVIIIISVPRQQRENFWSLCEKILCANSESDIFFPHAICNVFFCFQVEPQTADMMGGGMRGGGGGGGHDKHSKEAFGASADPQSSAFMDSFGEFHAPSPFGDERGGIGENSIVEPIAVGGGRNGESWPQRPAEFAGFEM